MQATPLLVWDILTHICVNRICFEKNSFLGNLTCLLWIKIMCLKSFNNGCSDLADFLEALLQTDGLLFLCWDPVDLFRQGFHHLGRSFWLVQGETHHPGQVFWSCHSVVHHHCVVTRICPGNRVTHRIISLTHAMSDVFKSYTCTGYQHDIINWMNNFSNKL